MFEIVAINAEDGSIGLQHFDGTIEEVDPEDWLTMLAEPAGAPEDWSGSVDISNEDLPGGRLFTHLDWQCEVDDLERDWSPDTEDPD